MKIPKATETLAGGARQWVVEENLRPSLGAHQVRRFVMFPRIKLIPQVSFTKARDRLIRSGLSAHEAVWVLLHGDREHNHVEKEKTCQACNRIETRLAEKGRRKSCADQ